MGEIAAELRESLALARVAGIEPSQLILDPGIGFAKNAAHSLEALRRLPELHALGRAAPGRPVAQELHRQGPRGARPRAPVRHRRGRSGVRPRGAHIVRVHDVREMAQVARVCDAILGSAA